MTGIPKHAARRDKNEAAIVKTLRAIGATVVRVSQSGAPDLLVGFEGETFLIEIKSLNGSTTEAQNEFHAMWKGAAITIARTPEAALAALRVVAGPPGIWRRCPMNACDGTHDDCREAQHHKRGTYPQPKAKP